MKRLLTIITFALLLSNCAQQKVNLDAEKQNIIKCWQDWPKKTAAGDVAYYWSDDVVIMSPGAPTIKGKKQFLKMYEQLSKMPGFKMEWENEPSSIDVSQDGQMAYLFARNKVSMSDSTGAIKIGTNQVLQVWKKDKDGNWRSAVSIMYPEN